MKKLLALLLILSLMLCALVACSPDDGNDEDNFYDPNVEEEQMPDDGSDPAMPDVNWPHDLPLA